MSAPTAFTLICPLSSSSSHFTDYLTRLQFTQKDPVQLIVISTDSHDENESQLSSQFRNMHYLRLPAAYSPELQINRALQASTEIWVAFILQPSDLSKNTLYDAIATMQSNAIPLARIGSGSIVIGKRDYIINNGMGEALLNPALKELTFPPRKGEKKLTGRFKDLCNRTVTLEYGEGSFIDPEVVVDSPEKIHIGSNTIIRKGVVLRPETGEIVIGSNCVINHYCVLHAKGGIYIGDWSIISPHCALYAQNHSFDRFDIPITKQPNIGNGIYLMGDNWIGSHSVLCDDVTLGKGAVIGANSTVTHSIPFATVAVGSPARVTKTRYGDEWDFHQRERASEQGMPENIIQYVRERAELLKRFISTGDTVLDVGCGEGIITAAVADNAPATIGCDYSADAIAAAQSNYPAITFQTANVTKLPFDNNTFSRVIFSEVAEHLMPIQLQHTLNEIARVLKDDGVLLLTTPVTGAGTGTSTYAHIYEYSQDEIVSMLNNHFSTVTFVHPGFGFFTATN